MIVIYVVDIRNVKSVNILNNKFISNVRKERIKKLKNERDILLSYSSEMLLNKAVTDLNISQIPVNYNYDHNGKPNFIDVPFHMSISHSFDKAMVAISDKNIGVDIQYKKKCNYEKLARRFFYKTERMVVSQNEFYDKWSMKEAYSKYLGLGLKKSFKQFEINNNTYMSNSGGYVHILDLFDDYSVCVCSEIKEDIKVIKL